MRTMLRSHTKLLFVVCALLLTVPAMAWAAGDQFQDTLMGSATTQTITSGGSFTNSYYVDAGGPDDCDVSTSSPGVFSINAPGAVSKSPNTNLTFTSCGPDNAQTVTFSSSTPGSYNIGASRVSGPVSSTGQAGFTLVVNAPADSTAPTTTPSAKNADNSTYTNDTWTRQNVTMTLNATDNTGGSGVQNITYSASGAQTIAQATQAGNSVTLPQITAEGTTTVSYFAKDNANNSEATQTFKVKIDKTNPTITGSRSPAANGNGWNNQDVTVSFACNDALSGMDSCAGGTTLTNETNGQSVTGTATDQAGNTASATVGGIKIDKTAPTNVQFVDGPNASGTYAFGSVPAEPTCDADFAISGKASCVVSGYSSAVGSHTMTATATDNADNIASATRSYTVTKADQATLTVDSPNSGTYGDRLPMAASGGTTNGAITFNVVAGSDACAIVASGPDQGKLEITDGTGTCEITATRVGNANYNDVTSQPHEVAVNKRDVQVTAAPKSKVYGNDDPALTYSITSGSLVNDDEFNGALSRVSGESVADSPYAIEQGTLSLPASKYVLHYVGDDLTIDPRPITVTPDIDQSKVYSDDDPPLTFHLAVGSSLGFDDTLEDATDGALSRTSGEDVGTYPINKGTLTATGNYTLSFVSNDVTFAITPKPITITPSANQSKYYGQDDPTLAFTPSPALKSGDNFTGALSRAAGTNVGNYAINLGDLSAGDNYTLSLSSTPVNFEIKARPITVTAVTDSKTYDGTTTSNGTPNVTPGVAGGIVSGDTAAFSQAFDTKNAGTGKTLTPSGKVTDGNNGNNYAYTFVNNNTGEIKQLGITGSFTADNKVYDGTNGGDGAHPVAQRRAQPRREPRRSQPHRRHREVRQRQRGYRQDGHPERRYPERDGRGQLQPHLGEHHHRQHHPGPSDGQGQRRGQGP